MIGMAMRGVVAAMCVLVAAPIAAQVADGGGKQLTAAEAAARFGAREGVQNISLSPDGTHVAIIVPAKARGRGCSSPIWSPVAIRRPCCRRRAIPTA